MWLWVFLLEEGKGGDVTNEVARIAECVHVAMSSPFPPPFLRGWIYSLIWNNNIPLQLFLWIYLKLVCPWGIPNILDMWQTSAFGNAIPDFPPFPVPLPPSPLKHHISIRRVNYHKQNNSSRKIPLSFGCFLDMCTVGKKQTIRLRKPWR